MAKTAELLADGWRWHQAGDLQRAEQAYRQFLRREPRNAQAWYLLGVLCGARGDTIAAAASLEQATALRKDFAEALLHRGIVFAQQGQLAEAEAQFREVSRLQPGNAQAQNNLGTVLRRLGRIDEAAASFAAALRLRPEYAEAHVNLGNVLGNRGRLEEAIAAYRAALQLKPGYAEAYLNLGHILNDLGRHDEAIIACRSALQLKPGYTEAYLNLGNVLSDQGRVDDAIIAFRTALQLKPDYAVAQLNLGTALNAQGRLDEGLAAFRTALQLKPDAVHIHSSLVFVSHFHPGYSAEAILEEARCWNQQHAEPLRSCIQPHRNRSEPERRLRIGYVSPDFREHATTCFTQSLFSNHDHDQFAIHCYADVRRPDAITERLRGHADIWHNTLGLTDEQVAELVRQDQIDILVDLTMHMANHRLLAFARKPAPVQVTWVAYPGTTGMSAIDYRLTDPYLDPPGQFDACYAEESIRLTDTFWCYDPLTAPVPINALPARQNGTITFGCLNNFCKINDGVLALWAKVLKAVPGSRLLLLAPPGQARDWALDSLQKDAIDGRRVEFIDKQSRRQYFQLYHRIDVCLDPFPYNGHTTSLDAFWMGVPTITLVGRTVVGRAGWSQLCNLGLPELAAQSSEDYVRLAAELAADLPRLEELRGTLRQRMERSPLMDAPRFARQVEHAFRQMWRRWCDGQPPHRR